MFIQFVLALTLVAGCAALSLGGRFDPPGLPHERDAALTMFAQGPAVNADTKTVAAFETQVQKFMAIHKKAQSALPRLPREATPAQIDRNQRELGRLIQEARSGARPGDIFVPEMQTYVRNMLTKLFSGAAGAEIKASVMDENPTDVKITVNGRYPDDVPLSTMPPQVLELLPKLPQELEYRFVGFHFTIFDSPAHIIVDIIPNVMTNRNVDSRPE